MAKLAVDKIWKYSQYIIKITDYSQDKNFKIKSTSYICPFKINE